MRKWFWGGIAVATVLSLSAVAGFVLTHPHCGLRRAAASAVSAAREYDPAYHAAQVVAARTRDDSSCDSASLLGNPNDCICVPPEPRPVEENRPIEPIDLGALQAQATELSAALAKPDSGELCRPAVVVEESDQAGGRAEVVEVRERCDPTMPPCPEDATAEQRTMPYLEDEDPSTPLVRLLLQMLWGLGVAPVDDSGLPTPRPREEANPEEQEVFSRLLPQSVVSRGVPAPFAWGRPLAPGSWSVDTTEFRPSDAKKGEFDRTRF
jgi:hypothetical protein